MRPARSALARQIGARWVVLDGYWVGPSYQRSLRGAGFGLLIIDDTGNAGALRRGPDPQPEPPCRREALPRGRIDSRRVARAPVRASAPGASERSAVSTREMPATARRILVTLGGSDPAEATERVVRALRPLAATIELRILVGPANGRVEAITGAGGRLRSRGRGVSGTWRTSHRFSSGPTWPSRPRAAPAGSCAASECRS